jgi:hypothetical protein
MAIPSSRLIRCKDTACFSNLQSFLPENITMTKKKKIKLDVFLCDIHLIITDDPNKYLDDSKLRIYSGDSPGEDVAKGCDGFVFQKDKSDYYVVLPPTAGDLIF